MMNVLDKFVKFLPTQGNSKSKNALKSSGLFLAYNSCVKRYVFKESFLKLDHFKKEIVFHENKFKKDAVLLKQKILDSVSQSSANFDFRDVSQILFLSKSIEDISLVTKAIKLLLQHIKFPKEQLDGLGTQLMRLVYVLDHSELGVKLLNDQELNQIFKSGYPKLILMDKLIKEKKYEKVVDLFQKYMKHYIDTKSRSTNKFLFPHDQFVLVSIALYKMNNQEAMDKMKQIMNMIRIKKLEFVNTSLPRCFLLAINQNEPEYALRLISKFENLNLTLGLNLSIIALSKMGFIEEALRFVENIISSKLDPDENRFSGRLFQATICALEEQIKSSKFLESSNQTKEKFQNLKNTIFNDKRFVSFDLSDLCKRPM